MDAMLARRQRGHTGAKNIKAIACAENSAMRRTRSNSRRSASLVEAVVCPADGEVPQELGMATDPCSIAQLVWGAADA